MLRHRWPTLAILLFATAVTPMASEPVTTDVYISGTGGYHTYRIPALLTTKKGTLLAFCEARKTSGADHGDIDLVLRRSKDGGRTWSPMTIVHEEGGTEPITIGNPSPVQDRKTGIIHLVFSRNNQRMFTTQSRDDGLTWSSPVEVTETLRPLDFAWTRIGVGPGHAIQLRTGRLLVPVWLNDRIRENYRSAAVYSEDGGQSWKAGGIVPPTIAGANECMLYERADGTVVVNFRSREHRRATAISRDGGVTWSQPTLIDQLPDPVCQGSILGLGSRVVFANLASETRRVDLTVRLSPDGGSTWPVQKLLHSGPAGYSDLAARNGTVFCLYENGETRSYERIRIARIPADWLR